MAANGEPAQEGGGRAEGEEDVHDEKAFFGLEIAVTGGHRSSALHYHHEEKVAGHKGIDGRELVAAAEALHRREQAAAVEAFRRGDAASEAALGTVRPAASRLRALVRKLWKPRAAPLDEGSRFTASAEVHSPPAARRTAAGADTAGAEERRTSTTEAALRYLTTKLPIVACRSGVGAGHDGDTSPPPHRPQQAAAVLPGRKSRGETGLMRHACRRRLGIARSSVSAGALPTSTPGTPRRDDSVLQAQDGVASAIAYCKLTLTPSRRS
ncbi:unnamed protein product [Urochloa humidicola]